MTTQRGGLRRLAWVAIASLVFTSGCYFFRKPKHPKPAPPPVTLQILNHAFADVDVYVMPSASGSGAMRLTTVSGFGKATLRIRVMQMQPGNILQLELHAIGTTTRWLTNALALAPGEYAMLEINSDATGDLSRSVLYPIPGPDNGDTGTAPQNAQFGAAEVH